MIGSGITDRQLPPANMGLKLPESAAATAAGRFAIILMFGPVSGAHFNSVVSFADAALGGIDWRDAAAYLPAQSGAAAVPHETVGGLAAADGAPRRVLGDISQ